MELITQIIISGILSAALSIVAYKLRMLTYSGALASLLVGYTVGVFGSLEWLILLIIFTAAGLAATKMDLSNKRSQGLQEGEYGERTYKNVLGVGIPAIIFAVLYGVLHAYYGKQYDLAMSVAFITTITVAAADTVASEIGVRDPKVWLITTFERVRRGTNGGISVLGTVSSTAAAIFTGLIGWTLIIIINKDMSANLIYVLIPIVMGILGNLLDSFLGAALENKKRISKYVNNSASALVCATLGALIILLL
ncbi:hypothetical protein Mpt1_c07620 [Candidatus Methanoplasma termitum]|uniref:DUF92 domain-containing protein n=1 Tax=Candidatus Methanoplasma termitum TaxID=1577791 RepID=A0A0A7LBX3_9ARCH|nr:DUF92 domain-containing protein [Candidatus Methanoplasma termitum]AIZ56645.1 hypothetical protein Mpt1_c07620 [Candidatus Methanoplasma termitum]MCL2333866.1 DUF92 domain-containing protein [Candidatus Methanoplasma sp.]